MLNTDRVSMRRASVIRSGVNEAYSRHASLEMYRSLYDTPQEAESRYNLAVALADSRDLFDRDGGDA